MGTKALALTLLRLQPWNVAHATRTLDGNELRFEDDEEWFHAQSRRRQPALTDAK